MLAFCRRRVFTKSLDPIWRPAYIRGFITGVMNEFDSSEHSGFVRFIYPPMVG